MLEAGSQRSRPQFDELRVGWIPNTALPPGLTAFIGDLAFDGVRTGCD